MIPHTEVQHLFSAKQDAAVMGNEGRLVAGGEILQDGYTRCMRLDDEGLAWAYGLALLYELAWTSYVSEFLQLSDEPCMQIRRATRSSLEPAVYIGARRAPE